MRRWNVLVPVGGAGPGSANKGRALGRRSRAFAALVLGLGAAVPVRAEGLARELRFQHLGVEQGLSDSWVHALLKDSRGFLWVGSGDGLNRYDGSSIVVYRARPGDAEGLASSEVRVLFEDGQKRLWVGAGGALHLYDRRADRFKRYPLGSETGASEGPQVRAIGADDRGQLWVGTEEGVFRVDPSSGASSHFRHDPKDAGSLSDDTVGSLLLDRRRQLWVGTQRGLNRFDPQTGRFVRLFQEANAPAWQRTMDVATMLEDEHGVLWLGTIGAGLVRFHPETGELARYLPDPGGKNNIGGDRILSLATDGKGRLFLGPEDAGLDVLEQATGHITHYRPDPEDPSSLSSSSLYQLRFDEHGILWIGTFNGGVDHVSPFGQRFGLMTARSGKLGNPHVLALLEDHEGNLWIGTDGGGLTQWNRRTGRLTAFRHDPRRHDSLAGDAVLALHEDAEHNIWVGTWAAGLDRLDPRTGRFEHHRNRSPTDSVFMISASGRDELLLGTFDRGAQEFSPSTGEFRALAARYPGLTANALVGAGAVDAQGNFWLAEPLGPVYVDRKAGTVTRSPLLLGAPQAFLVDSRGGVWIGTDSGGLYCLEADRRPRRRYTIEDGLPSDNVRSILEDEAGNLWLGTTRGLARILDGTSVPAKPQVLRFDVEDGLQGSEFKEGAAFRGAAGEMFFGGQRGFNFFFPEHIQTNPHPPPVVLTGLQLFNQTVTAGTPGSPLAASSITEAEQLTLSYRDSVVTFEFAALDFVLPSKNHYKYKLEGFDADWNEVGTRRLATYTNLPPGRYTLRVAGSNNDGVWNEDGARLSLRVTPPFWRTWLFQSMVCLGILGAAFAAHRWRVRRHLLAERVLKQRVQEALAEIKTLSGLLPLCAWCKKIRDDDGGWSPIEVYVSDRTHADFTHGICPECTARMRTGTSPSPVS
jgi:ligand-binding sensor domain-containing protein